MWDAAARRRPDEFPASRTVNKEPSLERLWGEGCLADCCVQTCCQALVVAQTGEKLKEELKTQKKMIQGLFFCKLLADWDGNFNNKKSTACGGVKKGKASVSAWERFRSSRSEALLGLTRV